MASFLMECWSLSPCLVVRTEMAFGIRMELLMRIQNCYDIALAHKQEGEIKIAPYMPNDEPRHQNAAR